MPTITTLYHSGFGHTKVVAEHVNKGVASVDGANAILLSVDDLDTSNAKNTTGGAWDKLHDADCIIFGAPTYMGAVSAPFKAFMDVTSKIWMDQRWRDKVAAGFTNSGNPSGDKVNTLSGIAIFAAQHSMIWVSQGLFPDGKGLNRLGGWLGMMAQSDNAPPDQTPPPEDRLTAERFGARVAEATARWVRGKA
ncbi:MAG: NADPH-dependent FMN reductase [Phycisphaerae bacterium]|nr:NADPH-dependent FMN reductase [Phycisphaerae bacterium]